MFHFFLFDDADLQFKTAANMDGGCAMEYWAEAIGLYRALAYQPSADDVKRGWELIQRAVQLGAKTQRERDYLHPAEILYRPDVRDYATRNHGGKAHIASAFSWSIPRLPESTAYRVPVQQY
jgi:hypothetical protein